MFSSVNMIVQMLTVADRKQVAIKMFLGIGASVGDWNAAGVHGMLWQSLGGHANLMWSGHGADTDGCGRMWTEGLATNATASS